MRLNADFSQRVVVRPADYEWHDSPSPGVERMMFDRIGGEIARATSLVRFAPDAAFTPHTHGGGEEFLVLEGAFGDEHAIYPAGYYVRNPVGTSHTPRVGKEGCLIFVKLYQMDDDDRQQFAVDTKAGTWRPGHNAGIDVQRLHEYGDERVVLTRWAPGAEAAGHSHPGGEEFFVIEGSCSDEFGEYPAGTWVRYPPRTRHTPAAGPDGALAWVKVGHLVRR